jgi:hypothetical protein
VLTQEQDGITEGLKMGFVKVAVEYTVVVEEEAPAVEFLGLKFCVIG